MNVDDTLDIGGDESDQSTSAAAAAAAPAAPPAKPPKASKTAALGLPATRRIVLEPNDNIPPTGQFIGHNGKGYILKPGEEVEVPQGIVDILNDAVETKAIQDPLTSKVIAHRDQKRLPFRVLR